MSDLEVYSRDSQTCRSNRQIR